MDVPGTDHRYALSCDLRAGAVAVLVCDPGDGAVVARTVAGLTPPARHPTPDDARPTNRIRVAGADVTDSPPGLRRNVGYLPPGGALLPHRDVQDNIWYGLLRQGDLSRQARERVASLTEALHLTHTLHLLPHELDDEQRFATSLARAVACRPRVLVVELGHPPTADAELQRLATNLETLRHTVTVTEDLTVVACSLPPRQPAPDGWQQIAGHRVNLADTPDRRRQRRLRRRLRARRRQSPTAEGHDDGGGQAT